MSLKDLFLRITKGKDGIQNPDFIYHDSFYNWVVTRGWTQAEFESVFLMIGLETPIKLYDSNGNWFSFESNGKEYRANVVDLKASTIFIEIWCEDIKRYYRVEVRDNPKADLLGVTKEVKNFMEIKKFGYYYGIGYSRCEISTTSLDYLEVTVRTDEEDLKAELITSKFIRNLEVYMRGLKNDGFEIREVYKKVLELIGVPETDASRIENVCVGVSSKGKGFNAIRVDFGEIM